MKDNSFDNAMSKIVGQHEAVQRAEARAQKRSEIFGRVRSVVLFLVLSAILVVTYNFREQLKAAILPKHAMVAAEVITNADGTLTTNSTPEGKTANIVNTAQQNAATRDAIIDQIAK